VNCFRPIGKTRYTFNVLILAAVLWGSVTVSAEEGADYRLSTAVAPVSQRIELQLDPSQPDYSGSTSIELQVGGTTDHLELNQVGLTMSRIELSSGGESRVLQATDGEWDKSLLADGEPISPGSYTLTIDFSGTFSTDALGLYRVTFEQNDYLFTQMEMMYARRAFPLFDEPSFKIPYQLIISAPEDIAVATNTPPESTVTEDGWQRVTFMQTPPLPSYLIALAAGPLDRVAIEGLSVPGHIYAPKGYGGELGFVLRETPAIVAALEDYFGSKYPYRKLDFVAAPEFAFGAMENPGLIIYRTDLLLVGDEASGTQATRVLNVIAHEVAHIWYGDVVTMAWWDDLWLNEAFATWMANSILASLYPQYEIELRLPQQSAFESDQLTTSKAIRSTVRTEDDIAENLGLNYTKGYALLRMLERYVGYDVWQRAIRTYMDRFAWRNATESDLWAVVSEESGIDIAKIASDYLNQPGFASVSIDGSGAVEQRRYARQGLEVEEQLWHIPMNVKYKAEGKIANTYMLLEGQTGTLDVPAGTDWIFPDAGANGYYRWATSADSFYNLIDDIEELSERERIALLDNSQALLDAGSLSMLDYLYVLERMLKEPHPLVFLPALEKVRNVGEESVAEEDRAAFARFMQDSLSDRYKVVGIRARPDDDEAIIQMRPRLVRSLGEFGSDETLLKEAAELVDEYFRSPETVQSQLALEAMRVLALHDDGSLYKRYVAAYKKSHSTDQRSNILNAMYFDEPEVVIRHLEFSLSDDVQAGDSLVGLFNFAYVLDDHAPLYAWLSENLERVLAKAPAYYKPLMPSVFASSCDRGNLDLLIDFFGDRGDEYQAALAKVTEQQEFCIARRNRHAEKVGEFLARY
jgi:aminopeptidase N